MYINGGMKNGLTSVLVDKRLRKKGTKVHGTYIVRYESRVLLSPQYSSSTITWGEYKIQKREYKKERLQKEETPPQTEG